MPTLSLGALRSTLIQESIKLPSPTPWGGIESSCWGRKSSGEEGKGKGRGREEGKWKGIREGKGKREGEAKREEEGKREEGKGKKGRGSKEGRREWEGKKWGGGRGNQVSGNFIHPCFEIY